MSSPWLMLRGVSLTDPVPRSEYAHGVKIDIPPRQSDAGYVRPPMTDQTFVPEVH